MKEYDCTLLTWDFESKSRFHFPHIIYLSMPTDMDKRGLMIPLVWWNVGPEYSRESSKPIQVHCPLAYWRRHEFVFFFSPFPTSKTSVGKSFKKTYVDCLSLFFFNLLFLKLSSPFLPYIARSSRLKKSLLYIFGNRVASGRFLPF